MITHHEDTLIRLAGIVDSLAAIAVDDRMQGLSEGEARALANDWRSPGERGELPTTVAGMCQEIRRLAEEIEGRVVPLRAAG